MTTRVIRTPDQLQPLYDLIGNRKLPITVSIKQGADRTHPQNHLQFKWMVEAANQLCDETSEEKRAYCKLHFGVPIRRNDDAEFREKYDRIIRPLPYEHKLALMASPFDFPVTREMSIPQMSQYLDAVYRHFTAQGVQLTVPEE